MAALVAVAAVAAGAVASCAAPEPPPAPPAPPTPTAPPGPPPPPAPPASAAPVLVIKIDNAREGRPAVGLGAADVVFVEPVEGGSSRIAAVFASTFPPVVGPVRSARETDLRFLPQYGRPAFAFSGAAPPLLPRIAKAPVRNASAARAPGAYFRDGKRPSPHNMFVRPAKLPRGDVWSPASQQKFGPTPPGGAPGGHQVVRYPAASVGFDWSAPQQRWLVSLDGRPAMSDNRRLVAGTVIVQKVPTRRSGIRDAAGHPSPVADTVGTGHALFLRDGQTFQATWSRPAPEQGTTYTGPDGQPLTLAAGQVWTVLSP
ncbi:MAG TPA: DUF3048 domain-containing protein [Pseudonocardia sp.]